MQLRNCSIRFPLLNGSLTPDTLHDYKQTLFGNVLNNNKYNIKTLAFKQVCLNIYTQQLLNNRMTDSSAFCSNTWISFMKYESFR